MIDDEIDHTIEMTVNDMNEKAIDDEYHFYRGLARHGELNKYYLRERGREGNTAYFTYKKLEEDIVVFRFSRLHSRMIPQVAEAHGFVEISDTVNNIMKFLLEK